MRTMWSTVLVIGGDREWAAEAKRWLKEGRYTVVSKPRDAALIVVACLSEAEVAQALKRVPNCHRWRAIAFSESLRAFFRAGFHDVLKESPYDQNTFLNCVGAAMAEIRSKARR